MVYLESNDKVEDAVEGMSGFIFRCSPPQAASGEPQNRPCIQLNR